VNVFVVVSVLCFFIGRVDGFLRLALPEGIFLDAIGLPAGQQELDDQGGGFKKLTNSLVSESGRRRSSLGSAHF